MSIEDKIKRCILTINSDIHEDKLNLDTKIFDDLGFDSLATIELAICIEDHYNISIETEMLFFENASTLRQWVNIVISKLTGKEEPVQP